MFLPENYLITAVIKKKSKLLNKIIKTNEINFKKKNFATDLNALNHILLPLYQDVSFFFDFRVITFPITIDGQLSSFKLFQYGLDA